MNKLTDARIQQRLWEDRNYKRLHFVLKTQYDEVKTANKRLKEQARLKAKFYFTLVRYKASGTLGYRTY